MPLPSLDGLVGLQLTCASSTRAIQLEVNVYVPELRPCHDLRIGMAAVGQLVGTVAEKLSYSTMVMPLALAGVLVCVCYGV